MLVQNDFSVRGHRRLQFAARIVDRDTNFERSYVVLLHTHGRNLCHLAGKSLVLERFHLNPRRLAQINLADIALIHFPLDVNLAGVAESHDQGCG